MSDPNYSEYITQKRAREAAAVDPDLGTDGGAGWFFRELSDGTVEWRPDYETWPPPGYRWSIDKEDRWATGGPAYTTDAQRRGRTVPKLEQIVSEPTHASRRPDVHFDSGAGVRYGS